MSRQAGRWALAPALTTVEYRTVDRDVQPILDNATGAFYDDFTGRSAEFTQVVLDSKSGLSQCRPGGGTTKRRTWSSCR